jgi:DNA-binding beta-propeller fold protein YncE
MLPDNKTFVVSIATKATLIYFDTVADKETKRVEVEFQPTILAAQGNKLFVGTKGTATVHVLDAATGKEEKEIKVPGEPLQALGCHPKKGLLYAVNTNNEVFSLDAEKGTATKTKAKGQLLAVDSGEGKFVYTGIQKPIRDQLVIDGRPGQKLTVSFAQANLRAVMLKYEVDGSDLKPIAVNDNAAINGRALAVSGDGKKIAMAGGGGWRSKTDPKANYAVAVFDTDDMQTLSGQVETGAYPSGIAFHPVLNLGAAYKDGHGAEIFLFSAKSFATKENIKVKSGAGTNILTFGGQGAKVIFAPMPGIGGEGQSTIEFLPIPLTDQDREALKKAYGK